MCNQNFHLLIYVLNYHPSLTKNNLTKILNHHKLDSNIHHLLYTLEDLKCRFMANLKGLSITGICKLWLCYSDNYN